MIVPKKMAGCKDRVSVDGRGWYWMVEDSMRVWGRAFQTTRFKLKQQWRPATPTSVSCPEVGLETHLKRIFLDAFIVGKPFRFCVDFFLLHPDHQPVFTALCSIGYWRVQKVLPIHFLAWQLLVMFMPCHSCNAPHCNFQKGKKKSTGVEFSSHKFGEETWHDATWTLKKTSNL